MLYGLDSEGRRIKAAPEALAFCPHCGEPLVAKCGSIVTHHWAHQAQSECDSWWEPETPWHLRWKSFAPPHRCEVTRGDHRADIVTADGCVVELQNSPLSVMEIQERERCYGRMVWILNGTDGLWKNFGLREQRGEDEWTFRWYHPRKSWWHSSKPIFIDCGVVEAEVVEHDPWYEGIRWDIRDQIRARLLRSGWHILELKFIGQDVPCGGILRIWPGMNIVRRIEWEPYRA